MQTASIVGPKEADGPLAGYFDKCLLDEHTEIKELYGVDIFLDNEYEFDIDAFSDRED